MQSAISRLAGFVMFVSLAALVCVPAHAQRQVITGNELFEWAQASQNSGSGAFSGFVFGVHDAFNEIMFCTSREVQRQQIEAAAAGFLKAHPELQRKSAADLVRQALAEAFPCK